MDTIIATREALQDYVLKHSTNKRHITAIKKEMKEKAGTNNPTNKPESDGFNGG
jgi:ribosomal silencing factor RsfS